MGFDIQIMAMMGLLNQLKLLKGSVEEIKLKRITVKTPVEKEE